MSHPFQQQQPGQEHYSQYGDQPCFDPSVSGFQAPSANDYDDQPVTSAFSDMHGNYDGNTQHLAHFQQQDFSHDAANLANTIPPPPDADCDSNSAPLKYWMSGQDAWNMSGQEAWNPAGPSRQNSMHTNEQFLEQFFTTGLFKNPLHDQPMEPLPNEHHGHVDAQMANFNPAAPLFTSVPGATDFLMEPNAGLRNQGAGQPPTYSPNLIPDTDELAQSTAYGTHPESRSGNAIYCTWPNCGKCFASKTAFRKHRNRHEKPSICPHPPCGRGFAEAIDMVRHLDAVHGLDLDGNTTEKRSCPVSSCDKKFSKRREDNLQQHLIRVHHMDRNNAKELISSPTPVGTVKHRRGLARHAASHLSAEPHSNLSSLYTSGCGATYPMSHQSSQPQAQYSGADDSHSQSQFQPFQQYTDLEAYGETPIFDNFQYLEMPANPSVNASYTTPDRTTPATELHGWPPESMPSPYPPASFSSQERGYMDQTSSMSIPPVSFPHEKMNQQQLCNYRNANLEASPLKIIEGVIDGSKSGRPSSFSPSSSALNTPFRPALKSFASAPEEMHTSMEETINSLKPNSESQPLANQILQQLEAEYHLVKKENSTCMNMESNASSPASSAGSHDAATCETCIKHKHSPSNLKKHLRRLTKPYWCPDENCSDSFGSKNDVMRHYNSRHENLEKFVCEFVEKRMNGRICGQDFNHVVSLENHLAHSHDILAANAKIMAKNMKTIDENFPGKFWCRCCACWYGLAGTAVERRVAMFTHLEDHLDGRNGQGVGGPATWQLKPVGGSQVVRRVLSCRIRTSAGNAAMSEARPVTPTPSERRSARPPPIHASYSADHKRHPSTSPTLRPQMRRKRLKSDTDVSHGSRDRDNRGTKPPRREATITFICCMCGDDLGSVATGVCAGCGHAYNKYCCQRRVNRQNSDEFTALDVEEDRDERGGSDARRGGRDRSTLVYRGLHSRSAT